MYDAACNAVGQMCDRAAVTDHPPAAPSRSEQGKGEVEDVRVARRLKEELGPRGRLLDVRRQGIDDLVESRDSRSTLQAVACGVVSRAAERAR